MGASSEPFVVLCQERLHTLTNTIGTAKFFRKLKKYWVRNNPHILNLSRQREKACVGRVARTLQCLVNCIILALDTIAHSWRRRYGWVLSTDHVPFCNSEPLFLALPGFAIYFAYGVWHSVEATYSAPTDVERSTDNNVDSCKWLMQYTKRQFWASAEEKGTFLSGTLKYFIPWNLRWVSMTCCGPLQLAFTLVVTALTDHKEKCPGLKAYFQQHYYLMLAALSFPPCSQLL